MKIYYNILIAALLIAVSLVVTTGCDYDVVQPLWYEDYTEPASPVITAIEPANAANPGINYITIYGENFGGVPDINGIYFGTTPVEIDQKSETMISVRRPNLVTDSCTVKVVSDSAFLVAKFETPYRIDEVIKRYGSFVENAVLKVVAVDAAENLYVVEEFSRYVQKVAPNGDKTLVGTASRAPTDASIGPDGNLYLAGNNRAIDFVNVSTGEVSQWTRLPSGKVVKYCDFDNDGYFYSGGRRTDIVVVPFDLSATPTTSGFYDNEEIYGLRFYDGYLYVISGPLSGTDPLKIYKHAISAGGSVGEQELVLDFNDLGDFSSRIVTSFAVTSNGTIFLATNSVDPLLIVNPNTRSADMFYKNIVPAYCKHMYWGNGSYTYIITGDTDLGEEWTVYRVDMGYAVANP
ncbi:IPT/TIG domain-containing protein [candidate division KSB1 bacterium]|nr:IPT/TIG domain-containing protein [candidate division KSB1 bacterium]